MLNAIEVKNLSKKFVHYPSQRDRLIDLATGGKVKRGTDFWALKNISFEVPQGTTFGIIGQNGSGKSTLLSILAGVLQPTSGTFQANGKVAAILELGSGFHHEFTGRENVYMYGTILGLSRAEIARRFDEIIGFSELHEFIDRPLYTYSSGMVIRLAFAVAVNVDADILIVDEALAVGDMFFQSKCILKMKEMINNKGATLLFVSHDVGAVKSLCEKSILLLAGNQYAYDVSDRVVEKYFSMIVENRQGRLKKSEKICVPGEYDKEAFFDNFDNIGFQNRTSYQRVQNGKAYFANVQLLDENEENISLLDYDQFITLRMSIKVLEDIPVLVFGYHIRDKNGIDIVYSDSIIENKNIYAAKFEDRYIVDWKFRMPLLHGSYTIASALSIPIDLHVANVNFCDFVPLAVQFRMQERADSRLYGAVHLNNTVKVAKV